MPIPSFLEEQQLRLLLFGGKGGVGKTTCAASTALWFANLSYQSAFLLVSTDPAHSLTDSMAGFSPPSNLEILELDAQKILESFKGEHGRKLREIASRGTFLDDEDINQLIDLSLPGLDELMAFFEISRWVDSGDYDCIFVDTAPTGHTMRLLGMPALIRKWLGALDALLAKHRYMKMVISRTYNRDELDNFLMELSFRVKNLETLLGDPLRSRFVPVMLAEDLSLSETALLMEELKSLKVAVTDIVVNRVYPESKCPVCAGGRRRQMEVMERLFREGGFSGYSLWGVPLYPEEVRGLESLNSFWDGVQEFTEAPIAPIETLPALEPRVEEPFEFPPPQTALLLFAGKGGVGKTTLACATALRLAQEIPGKEVLLFSSDPAHSLSDCLRLEIGSEPTRLTRGLFAMEINAQAEFDSLKTLYQEEVEQFLRSALPNIDITFDREVMTKILDLAPPGLDEIMALTRMMGFLQEDRYDVLIIDSAPTGHLIRLLELPEIIDQWLKVFFDLLLKYKRVFRLPKVSQRLVKMSKELKRLRSLLKDRRRSALYGVAVLQEMAFHETLDLAASCERIEIGVPVLFLNLATPQSDCPLCSAQHGWESQVKERFRETFLGIHQPRVYRWGDPRGIERLGQLGRALYRAPRKEST